MVARYWVGVDSNWHLASNWSAISGGVGGAGIPTSSDDVYIDGNGYVLCWATTAIACNNLTLEATMTEMLLLDQGGVIWGDYLEKAGYFGPTGGGGYTVEFKGNWELQGGTFAVGTGTGVDPTCEFSGTTKTYQNNSSSTATYQHFLVSGEYVFSGTKLSVAYVSQEFKVTGTLDITETGLTVNRIDLGGTFTDMSGTIEGTGRIFFKYGASDEVPSDGTINCKYFTFNIEAAATTIYPRQWGSSCTVEIDYNYDAAGQVVTFAGTSLHYFKGNLLVDGTSSVISAELNWDTNTAQVWVTGSFNINNSAFTNLLCTFTIKLGNNTHAFLGIVDFYYSHTSGSNFVLDPGEGIVILNPKSTLRVAVPIGGGI